MKIIETEFTEIVIQMSFFPGVTASTVSVFWVHVVVKVPAVVPIQISAASALFTWPSP